MMILKCCIGNVLLKFDDVNVDMVKYVWELVCDNFVAVVKVF